MSLSYPTLTEIGTTRDFIESFGGYNHNLRIGENEFYDMKNLTSTHYPVLSSRLNRGSYPLPLEEAMKGNVTAKEPLYHFVGCFGYEGKVYRIFYQEAVKIGLVDGGIPPQLYVECEEKVEYEPVKKVVLSLGETDIYTTDKRIAVNIGSYIVIFPDKKYINMVDTEDKGDLEASFVSDADVTFSLCRMDGTDLTPDSVGSKVPTDATNGYLWLDTSVTPASLKQYSEASERWVLVAATYIKIQCTGIGAKFNEYDGVQLSGITVEALKDLNASTVIHSKGDDYIVVVGVPSFDTIYDENGMPTTIDGTDFKQNEGTITVERKVPEMDFVIESNNRLWGCRHGLNRKGDMVNEIYASKLGDFKNWEYFGGTSQDSYMVSLGSEGAFTGAISYNGKPHFFKQNILHIIYGSYPATYQLQNIECKGVQEGCSNSLVIVDNILYYKTTGSVCAYSGSFPTDIGYQLHENDWRYTDAFGGCFRHKYYLLLNDVKNGECPLFVYDTEKGVWHKEGVKGFDHHVYHGFINFSVNNVDALGYFNESYTECIKMVECIGDYAENETINWFAETGIMGCSSPDKKYISRISLRLSLDVGTRVFVSFEYDSSGVWEQVATITGTNLHTFTLPIKARRCDHLRMKIEGNGAARIYSISKTIEQGSDV